MTRTVTSLLAVFGAIAVVTGQTPTPAAVDAAFSTFLQAPNPRDAAVAADQIVRSGATFDDALKRLKAGRVYSPEVPRGVVQASYRSDSGEYFYTLDVPETYDPSRKYQVRVQLHGGVGRIETNAPPRPGSNARLAGAEQIYVMPYAWRDAPWWSARQTENLRAILDLVKRSYNVDENRVVLSGVSDGGTGAYFTAMRETTLFASVLPLNGFFMVLRNEMAAAEGDLFPHNLVNKPMFIVNGGRDPQYPTSAVDPYVAQLKNGGVTLVYRPQPNAAHDTSWWPELKGEFETFVTEHPRRPSPDVLTWEAGGAQLPGRAHWLVIDRLAPRAADATPLPDLNRMAKRPELDFGIRGVGNRINRVARGSNAEQIGLKSGDMIVTMNNQPMSAGSDVAEMLRNFPSGRPLILSVTRGSESVRLTGRYAPTVIAGEAETMFPPQAESGRVDLVRNGNAVQAITRGVGAFTLLLSPDQFDLNRAVTVVVNGRTTFEGVVQKDLPTLLKWAAGDNDRTMLFAAEVHVNVK
jgi:poly(3-hydroxybutyrate) depolymerase